MIRPRSEKGVQFDKEYYRRRDKFILESRKNNTFFCIFCGKANFKQDKETRKWHVDVHHAAGREGISDNDIKLLHDIAGFCLCHRFCHNEYDMTPMSEVVKSHYWSRLSLKIKAVDKAMYEGIKNNYL